MMKGVREGRGGGSVDRLRHFVFYRESVLILLATMVVENRRGAGPADRRAGEGIFG